VAWGAALKAVSAPITSVSSNSTSQAANGMAHGFGPMNGLPHKAKMPPLGFADTVEEAKQAASDIFDVCLERAGLMIAVSGDEERKRLRSAPDADASCGPS